MPFSTSVWVAAIGALASVTAAICAVVAAMRSARLKAEADLVLERFKAEDARRRHAFEVATRESEPLATGLARVWNDIQVVRDVIHRAVSPAIYDEQSAMKTLREASASIADAYGRFGGLLPSDAALAFHDAKNRVNTVEALLRLRGTGAQPRPEAAQGVRAHGES